MIACRGLSGAIFFFVSGLLLLPENAESFFLGMKRSSHPHCSAVEKGIFSLQLSPSKDSLLEDESSILMRSIPVGPGHTDRRPASSTARSQKELTKAVLSSIILWITWEGKFKNLYKTAREQIGLPTETEAEDLPEYSDSLQAMAATTTGVAASGAMVIEDVKAGTGARPATPGDSLRLRFKLLYNGVVVIRGEEHGV